MNYKLTKEERIYKRDELQKLFRNSASFSVFPFKVVHYQNTSKPESSPGLKFAVSVPKRNYKKAVDRNLLKRRVREAYRLNKNELKSHMNNKNIEVLFMLIYIGKEPLSFDKIQEKIILILQRLHSIYAENNK